MQLIEFPLSSPGRQKRTYNLKYIWKSAAYLLNTIKWNYLLPLHCAFKIKGLKALYTSQLRNIWATRILLKWALKPPHPHHLCGSNYKYLIQRGNHLTFAQIPPHSHLWMARRGASPRHFHGDTVWWTAGPPPRNKPFTWPQWAPLSLFSFSFCGFCLYATGVGWLQKLNNILMRLIKTLIQSDCQLYQFHVMDSPPSLIICGARNAQGCKGCMKPCGQLQLQRPFRLCPLVIDLQINEEKYLVKCQYM